MRYELMLPHHIRSAIAARVPVVLPLGVLEYHGEHLGLGMDTLAVTRCLDLLDAQHELVILPPFYYGASSHAVAAPEGKGSIQVEASHLLPVASDMFMALLRTGFRNLHVIIHHQSENFAAGMPTDLAFKLAGRQAIFRFLERERGEGFWGDEGMADYYAQHGQGTDPFNWIKVHPLMSPDIMARYPFDHAGKGETSLMMALCPEAVDMARHDAGLWYSRDATEASAALGGSGVDLILTHLRHCLGLSPSSNRTPA
jgi:creatinine amidohydrolase